MLPSTLDKKRNYKKQVMFLLLRNIHSCYFLQLSSETWRLWVKQRDQSKPPTQTKNDGHKKQNQQTTEESKVYIILTPFHPPPPPPNEKIWPVGERLKTRFFYRVGKIIHPPPKKKKITLLKKVQSRFSIWPLTTASEIKLILFKPHRKPQTNY